MQQAVVVQMSNEPYGEMIDKLEFTLVLSFSERSNMFYKSRNGTNCLIELVMFDKASCNQRCTAVYVSPGSPLQPSSMTASKG